MIQIEKINELTGDTQHVCYYQISDLAKALRLKIGKRYAGRNLMFRILKAPQNKILTKDNQPAQFLINQNLMLLYGIQKSGHYYYSPVLTEKGLNYLINGFKSGRYTPVFEPKPLKKNEVLLDDIC